MKGENLLSECYYCWVCRSLILTTEFQCALQAFGRCPFCLVLSCKAICRMSCNAHCRACSCPCSLDMPASVFFFFKCFNLWLEMQTKYLASKHFSVWELKIMCLEMPAWAVCCRCFSKWLKWCSFLYFHISCSPHFMVFFLCKLIFIFSILSSELILSIKIIAQCPKSMYFRIFMQKKGMNSRFRCKADLTTSDLKRYHKFLFMTLQSPNLVCFNWFIKRNFFPSCSLNTSPFWISLPSIIIQSYLYRKYLSC